MAVQIQLFLLAAFTQFEILLIYVNFFFLHRIEVIDYWHK